MNELDNPDTAGMDGADRDTWHTPQHDISGRMLTTAVGTATVVLLLTALVWVIYATNGVTVTLSVWVVVALAFGAAGCGFALGVVLLAAVSMAGQTDDAIEAAAHE